MTDRKIDDGVIEPRQIQVHAVTSGEPTPEERVPPSRIELATDPERSWDQLDGVPLKDGELLYLEWPDGTGGTWRIKIQNVLGAVRTRAIVEDEYLGQPIQVALRGLPARRAAPEGVRRAARVLAEAQAAAAARRKVLSEEEAAARIAKAGDAREPDLGEAAALEDFDQLVPARDPGPDSEEPWVDEDAARDYARENPDGSAS